MMLFQHQQRQYVMHSQERLQSVRDTVTSLYNRTYEKLGYCQTTTLHDIVEEEAKQDYIGLEDIKHLHGREKETTDDGIEDMSILTWS